MKQYKPILLHRSLYRTFLFIAMACYEYVEAFISMFQTRLNRVYLIAITGITDLTTTEGNLRNFSRICKLVHSHEPLSRKRLIELVKNYAPIKRRNEKVIGRHISILKNLGLLKKINGEFCLSSEGEVLYELIRDIDDREEKSSLHEKVFYFKAFFGQTTFAQLSLLLKVMRENEGKAKDEVTAQYFKVILRSGIRLWRRDALKRRLDKYERTSVLKRPEKNRFDCMKMWLRALGLIKNLSLTPTGERVLSEIDLKQRLTSNPLSCYKNTRNNIYRLACFLIKEQQGCIRFNYSNGKHRKIFLELFKEAYFKFERPTLRLSNVKSIGTWISLNLLVPHSIVLEEREFNSLVDKLYRDGIIESIVPGDYGKTTYVKIKSDNP